MAESNSDEEHVSKSSASPSTSTTPNGMGAAERRLLSAARRGDERAFTRLVLAYQDRVFGLCMRMLGRADEAEDMAQEVFVALHKGLIGFRGEARLSTWIYRIARNHCLNRLKYLERRPELRHSSEHEIETILEVVSVGPSFPSPEQHLEGVELQRLLEDCLRALPGEQRLLLILRDIEGLSYEEISDVCELPSGTVKSRLHRARVSLSAAVRGRQEHEPARAAGGEE